jgi:cell division protein FtsZ
VGGGGGNALNHIIESGVSGVEFVAANTDSKALDINKAPHKIVLGEKLTRGRGAGADPQVGTDAAKESLDRIREYVNGSDMVFVTAGMGGGTGTGAAPIIAEVAKETGGLVVGVVTTPFSFEGKKRALTAQEGITRLKEKVDALLVVENDRLLGQIDNKTTSKDAYRMANEVLRQAVQGVTDLIMKPGIINVDFADVRTVMKNAGTAIMGIGEGEGDNRAELAAKSAIKSPLMSLPLNGAKGMLINIEAGPDAGLFEMTEAVKIINATADDSAQVIWGHAISEDMGNKMRITVIATGFSEYKEKHSAGSESPIWDKTIRTVGIHAFSFDEKDWPAGDDNDIFSGVPKAKYDTPSILRKPPQK